MRRLLSAILLLLPALLTAQSLKHAGTSASDFVPDGWEVQEARGDLNKDGCEDLVIIATPNDAENMMTRDDGYVYNFNQPVLAICLGSADGGFKLWKEYDNILAHQEEEYFFINHRVKIMPNGTLQIGLEHFSSAGSNETQWNAYIFRFQGGDMMLIGQDTRSLSRYSGEEVEVSKNYLTHKCKKTLSNAFKQDVKPKVVWTSIPKAKLRRLGNFRIE